MKQIKALTFTGLYQHVIRAEVLPWKSGQSIESQFVKNIFDFLFLHFMSNHDLPHFNCK